MKYIIEKWKEAAVILAMVVASWNFYGLKVDASDAKQTADRLTTLAERLADPNQFLYQYLILHNIDSVRANIWAHYPREPLRDGNDKLVPGVPFLNKGALPEVGILLTYKETDSTVSLLTVYLWDFREVKDSL